MENFEKEVEADLGAAGTKKQGKKRAIKEASGGYPLRKKTPPPKPKRSTRNKVIRLLVPFHYRYASYN